MSVEDVSNLVKLADDLVFAKKQLRLNNLQKEVLYGALEGLKYKEIQADETKAVHYYPVKHIASYIAYELWKLLTEVLQEVGVLLANEKVTKNNIREYLERVTKQSFQLTEVSDKQPESSQKLLEPKLEIPTNSEEICWVGREQVVAELSHKLLGDCRILSIVGITGIGKTALAGHLTIEPSIAQTFPVLKTVNFDSEHPGFDIVARCILGEEIATNSLLKNDSERLVAEMIGRLRLQPCLLILDMVEEVLEIDNNNSYQFKEPIFTKFLSQVVRTNLMPSRIIITSQYQFPVIAEGRYLERTYSTRLKGLEESEALQLFAAWEINIQTQTETLLKRLICVYEGHPLALRVIAGEIREAPYNGELQAYWYDYGHEIETVEQFKNASEQSSREDKPRLDRYSIDLSDLVKTRVEKSFTRLFQASQLACVMLCMGAKYRRAVERKAWLLLIDEYSDEEALIAFQTLQRRFFLEEEYTARKVLYRLHSLIRRVALDNLPKIEEELL